jgi:hypothetical protein
MGIASCRYQRLVNVRKVSISAPTGVNGGNVGDSRPAAFQLKHHRAPVSSGHAMAAAPAGELFGTRDVHVIGNAIPVDCV